MPRSFDRLQWRGRFQHGRICRHLCSRVDITDYSPESRSSHLHMESSPWSHLQVKKTKKKNFILSTFSIFYIISLVMGAAASDRIFILERSIVGLLLLTGRLMRREDVAPIVLQSLRMLLLLKPQVCTVSIHFCHHKTPDMLYLCAGSIESLAASILRSTRIAEDWRGQRPHYGRLARALYAFGMRRGWRSAAIHSRRRIGSFRINGSHRRVSYSGWRGRWPFGRFWFHWPGLHVRFGIVWKSRQPIGFGTRSVGRSRIQSGTERSGRRRRLDICRPSGGDWTFERQTSTWTWIQYRSRP